MREISSPIKGSQNFIRFQASNEVNRPYFGCTVNFPDENEIARGLVLPENISIKNVISINEMRYSCIKDHSLSGVWAAEILPDFPWIPAMLGYSIVNDNSVFKVDSRERTIERLHEMKFEIQNSWIERYISILTELSITAESKFPISIPNFSGGLSVLTNILGLNAVRLLIKEETQVVLSVVDSINKYISDVIDLIIRKTPLFNKGYILSDVSAVFSEPYFIYEYVDVFRSLDINEELTKAVKSINCNRDMFLGIECDIVRGKESLLDIPHIKGVIIDCKKESCILRNIIPFLRLVQEKKNVLIISCTPDIKDLDLIMDNLHTSGMYINLHVDTLKEAMFWYQYLSDKLVLSNELFETAID